MSRKIDHGHRHRHAVLLLLFAPLAFFLSACGQTAIPTAQPAQGVPSWSPIAQPTSMPRSTTATPQPAVSGSTPIATLQPAPTGEPAASAALAIPPVLPWMRVTPTPPALSAATPAPLPTPLPRPGLPVRLTIPTIGVDAEVEHVGLAPDGAMDVPKNYANTAWYAPGTRPGERGNAAINGHVDSKTGKAIFWDLKKLKPGDEIIVGGDDGVERTFVVTSTEIYKRAEAPLNRIFGPAAGAYLNLITCDGVFDRRRQEYDSNLVVYTEVMP